LDATDRGPYQAPCRHYPHCIGCPFIDLPYPEQLARKRALVGAAFARFPVLKDVEIPEVVPSPRRLGYRARVKLVVRKSSCAIATGLYDAAIAPGDGYLILSVHPRRVNQGLGVPEYRAQGWGSFLRRARRQRDLRYVDFRYNFARQEVSVTLVAAHPVLPGREAGAGAAADFPVHRDPQH
jgi:tRNA/tmRNA/rRNA uracil-C5-methylase (TrmA/RlmC/RlmD family)